MLQEGLSLDAVLLKPQMAIPGSEFTGAKAAPAEVAHHTLGVMRRSGILPHSLCFVMSLPILTKAARPKARLCRTFVSSFFRRVVCDSVRHLSVGAWRPFC